MATASTLTEAAIQRFPAAPEGGRVDRPDKLAPGLFLRINDRGVKAWMCHFRVDGKQGKIALGHWPAIGVAEARELARAVREKAKAGVHPKDARAAEATVAAAAAASTFKAVAEQYLLAMEKGQLTVGRRSAVTTKTARGRGSILARLVFPALGTRPIDAITTQDVARLLAKIERDEGPVDETLKTVRLVFKFAAARGLFAGTPPTQGLAPRQTPEHVARALTDEELRAFWRAASLWGFPYGHAVKLLMLTGQRRGEIGDARWENVDWDRGLLIVPQERAKNRAGDHEVPLSVPALAVLREAQTIGKALGDKTGFVFPNAEGTGPINGWEKTGEKLLRNARALLAGLTEADVAFLHDKGGQGAEARARKAALVEQIEATPDWRLHDLRHNLVTRLRIGEENEEGETTFAVPLDVVQACVNHKLTTGITAIYDHSDLNRRYRLRKREALGWWAEKLMQIVGEG